MNKQFGLVILVVVVIGGFYFLNSNSAVEDSMMKEEVDLSEMNDEVMEGGDEMSDSGMEVEVVPAVSGSYTVYTAEKLAMAEKGDVVLFFKASWCPSCRAADIDIKNSLSDIPVNVTILEVDYDEATDLKKKYGVTSQHTFVQVDASGELLKKWSGGLTLESVLGNII